MDCIRESIYGDLIEGLIEGLTAFEEVIEAGGEGVLNLGAPFMVEANRKDCYYGALCNGYPSIIGHEVLQHFILRRELTQPL